MPVGGPAAGAGPAPFLPRKSAEEAPNPPAAAAMCPRCSEGCWRTGLCGDAGLGLGARMLSMVKSELPVAAFVVVAPTRVLNTGLNPSPRKTFPRKCWGPSAGGGLWLGCGDVSTILKSSSL